MNRLALSTLLCCSLFTSGCNSSSNAPAQQAVKAGAEYDESKCGEVKPGVITSANKYCVVMLADPVDPNLSVDYKGQKVGFCCPGCTKKWDKMNDTQKDAALAAAIAKK